MTYHSTRGKAPILAFDDVLLSGLASDGGLYLPDQWPHFSPQDWQDLARLSYQDLAVRVMAPFLDGTIAEDDLAAMVARAYEGFDHAAIAPLVQLGRNDWLLELFHGPTLAFKDYALQLLGQLFDHVLTRRGERVTIVGATSGDTGGAAIEACKGRDAIDIIILHPEGRTSEVQRRQMTSVSAKNVHNIAIKGSFDDCQDLVKAMFNDSPFRQKCRLSAVNSINWARILGQIVYYVAAALSLGAPKRAIAFSVPTGNFGNVYAGLGARALGLPISQLVIGSNRNDILTRFFASGRMQSEGVVPTLSPSMDIQISSNFERYLFDLTKGDSDRVTRLLAGFRQSGGFEVEAAEWQEAKALFSAQALDDAATLAAMHHLYQETGLLIDPHSAIGVIAGRNQRRDAETPIVALATAHAAKFPDAVQRATGIRPALPPHLADLFERPERYDRLPNDLAQVQDYVAAVALGNARIGNARMREARMSGPLDIEQTRLDNGLLVITDRMRTVETVSLGVWVDAGTRHEAPEINGISHLLEHMAFKGTERRSAMQIAEEIEAVGGVLNAYTSRDHTAYYAKILKEDVGLGVDILADILLHSSLDPDELAREQAVVVQEIAQAIDTPDDIIFDHLQATAFPQQAMGRPVLGTAELVRSFTRKTVSNYLRDHYGTETMILAAAGNLDHQALVRLAETNFAGLSPTPARAQEPARYQGGDYREERDLEQVHLVLGFEGVSYEDPDYYAMAVLSGLLGGGMSSRLFQEVRERRGLAYSVYSFTSSFSDGGLFAIYAGTGADEARDVMPVLCDEVRKVTQAVTLAEVKRSRAQIKAGILMGLESTNARCEQVARQIMVHGRVVPVEELVAKVEAVDEEAVLRVAGRLFSTQPTVAALGPLEGVASYKQIEAALA